MIKKEGWTKKEDFYSTWTSSNVKFPSACEFNQFKSLWSDDENFVLNSAYDDRTIICSVIMNKVNNLSSIK